MGRFLMIGRSPAEPQIKVSSREQLFYLLAGAAEIEHNLMCCYLYAAFGLKTEADGLAVDDAAEIARWRSVILADAVEEMTHLSLVANLTLSVGGTPHFGRPNFPIAAGYHPSGVVVELHSFDRATLDHFIYLERPEGVDLPDGEGFAPVNSEYRRERLMPGAQDYLTVGHLYRAIHQAIENLSDTLGETALFVDDPRQQVGPSPTAVPGLIAVTDRASALTALLTIIELGEGSPSNSAQSHYRRFLAVRHSYDRLLADKPGFTASRPVAKNPVMRLQPSPAGKIYVDHPGAAEVMDLANAIYGLLLGAIAQGFAAVEVELKKALLEAAIDTVAALSRVAQHLTSLPASKAVPGVRAGMSFAMVRNLVPLPSATAAVRILAERLTELALGAATALAGTVLEEPVARTLREIGASLSSALDSSASAGFKALPGDKANAGHLGVSVVVRAAMAAEGEAIEVVKGACITIAFEAKRCIHAQFCVLQQPNVFRANVVGAWLVPDDATSAEALVAMAQTCPSGAIQYRRHDGGAGEVAPPISLIQRRTNKPLVFRGDLHLDYTPIGFRATLCRCGARNKPFCEGSHDSRGFSATGEPASGDLTPLLNPPGRSISSRSTTGRLPSAAPAARLLRPQRWFCAAAAPQPANPIATAVTPGSILSAETKAYRVEKPSAQRLRQEWEGA